jgi:hypothetical protein
MVVLADLLLLEDRIVLRLERRAAVRVGGRARDHGHCFFFASPADAPKREVQRAFPKPAPSRPARRF